MFVITDKTKTRTVVALLNDKNIEEFIDQVPEVELDTKITEMTIADFEDAIDDTQSYVSRFLNEKYALIAFGKIKRFRTELESTLNYIKSLSIEGDDREKQASEGIQWPSMCMRMRLDLCESLHLHDLKDAEKKELWQWIAFEQRKSAVEQYNRRFSELSK